MFQISLKTPLDQCFWCSNIQKKLVKVNPPKCWPWKQNGYQLLLLWWFSKLPKTEEACYRYFEKKLDLNPNHLSWKEMYDTITILEWLVVSKWHICLTEITEKNISNWVIISINLTFLGYFKRSTALWLFLNPSCKSNSIIRIGWFRPRVSPDAYSRVYTKNRSWIQILDMILKTTTIR